jgi:hypothetical protein
MLMEYMIRFLAGGVIVSLFAMIGDVLRPKSFAGLFGAAPSIASSRSPSRSGIMAGLTSPPKDGP